MTRGRIEVPDDLAAVTTRRAIDDAVLREAGLTRAACDSIWRGVERLYRTGVHPAIGLCVRRRGHVVLDRAIGHARGHGPDRPASPDAVLATPDTPFGLFSASKAVTAVAVHLLAERGALRLGDSVAEHVPGFERRRAGSSSCSCAAACSTARVCSRRARSRARCGRPRTSSPTAFSSGPCATARGSCSARRA